MAHERAHEKTHTMASRKSRPNTEPVSRRADGTDFGEPVATARSGEMRRLSVQRALRHPDIPPRTRLLRWLRHALPRTSACEVTIRFVDEAEGRELNRSYRGRDYATNVLSFVYETEPVVRGDLAICMPIVVREAAEQGKSIEAHCAHMVVHGLLHLQGLDHDDDAEAEVMEEAERTILARLGYDDPYAIRNDGY